MNSKFLVNLGTDAVKSIKSKNSAKKYLFNRVAQSFLIEAVTPNEIIDVTNQLQSKNSSGNVFPYHFLK